jgi:hypothetical protein
MNHVRNDLSSDLETLVGELNNVSRSYDPSAGLEGFKSRAAVITKAKQIAAMMTDPSDLAFMHSTNVGAEPSSHRLMV